MMIDIKAELKRGANWYLNAGISEQTSFEIARKINVLNLFALVGFTICFILGTRAALDGEWSLSASLYLAFLLFFSSHIYIRYAKSKYAYSWASLLLQAVLIILGLFLVYSGGANNTGPLWIYLIPPVVMFFSGMKRGLYAIAIFTLLYCLVVFFPDNRIGAVAYSYEFKTRLLYSFLTLTFLAGFYEYTRSVSFKNLMELKRQFELQATLDPLTQLLNRRGMLERIESEAARSKRNHSNLSVVIADVDYFKRINDHYGHRTGDEMLIAISKILKNTIRKQDSVARWGGEEFLFLLPDTQLDQAIKLAEKLRQQIEQSHFSQLGDEDKATMSFGVAQVIDFTQVNHSIQNADEQLYKAKKQGRNCVVANVRI